MNSKDLDRLLNEWIDRAASEYGKAEIRSGFETRILEKLNSRLARRRLHFRWIAVTTVFAAILFLSVYLPRNQFREHKTKMILSESVSRSEALPAAGSKLARKQAISSNPSQSKVPIPESSTTKDVRGTDFSKAREAEGGRFMSSGLSNSERYLIAFVRATSDMPASGVPESATFEPLKMDPLRIEGVQIPEFQIQDFKISSFKIEASPLTTP